MRIAHINLAKGFRGGERQTVLLIKELALDGVEQILVCRDDSPMREMLADVQGVEFVGVNHFLLGHIGFDKKVDLIHAHESKGARWAWIENIIRKSRYIITRRVMFDIKKGWATRSMYRRASVVVGLSRSIEQILKEYDRSLNVAVIPSVSSKLSVNIDEVQRIRSRFEGKKIIGHIGALSSEKGHAYIIEAARELLKERQDLVFLFVGGGKDEAKLKEQAKGLDNVCFEEFRSNVADYIASFDLFVFPSLAEGLGSVLIDVMMLEVPVIATPVGGIVDLIEHQKTGVLIEPKSSDAIKNAVLDLIDKNPLDLISNAKKKAERFTPEHMAKSYLAVYRQIVNS